MFISFLRTCECGFKETRETPGYLDNCPQCGKRVKVETKMEQPKPIKLSEMGICRRCGKFASSGAWIKGEWYGPECKDKVGQ